MPNTAIKVSHLTKVYKLYDKPIDRLKESLHPLKKKYHKDFYALNDVSFEIKKGETVGIIGKNGAGKSTLLKIITGVLTPSSGHVHVNGRIASLLELGAGFNPEYTGVENIYLQGTLMGYSKEEMEAKIDEILAFADIGDFVYQPVKSYSSGMFARLAFAININVNPDILIVDEALAVGDMNFQAKCMTAMDKIREKGTTVLFVSHDIGSVKSLCSRGIYIKNGNLHYIGKASDASELYIRESREESNKEHKKLSYNNQTTTTNSNNEKNNKLDVIKFIESKEFDKKVSPFRYGSGGAKIIYADLVNINNESVVEVEFGQKLKLQVHLYSEIETQISLNYYVLDDKKIYLFGGGPRTFGYDLIKVENNKSYIIEYVFSVPLQEGIYSISLECNLPIVINQTAEFLDVIENAVVFKVQERKISKLWAKFYLDSTFKVYEA